MVKVNRNYAIFLVFVTLSSTSTVYPIWGWSTLSAAFSGSFDRVCTAISDISPKFVAVGCAITASIAAFYCLEKIKTKNIAHQVLIGQNKAMDECIDGLRGEVKGLRQASEYSEGRNSYLEEENKKFTNTLKVACGKLAANKARISELENQAEDKVDMSDAATQTGDLQEWEVVQFNTPDVVKAAIEQIKNGYNALYKDISEKWPIASLSQLSEADVSGIKTRLMIGEGALQEQRTNLHTLISVQGSGSTDALYQRLQEEYKANNDRIPKKFNLLPEGYYEFVGLKEGQGRNMSSTNITNYMADWLTGKDQDYQWAIRQIGYVMGNEASKNYYDAYLSGQEALASFLFEQQAADDLSESLRSIDVVAMPIKEYCASLRKAKAKLIKN